MATKNNIFIRSFLILCTLFICQWTFADSITKLNPAPAISSPNPSPSKPPAITPPPPTLDAKGYVLIDANTGQIIAQKNMNDRMPPASLTKMMSLYLVSSALANGQIKLDDPVRISKKAWKTGGSRMFIRANTSVPVQKLIQGVIVDSGNDATVALAEYLAGSTDSFVPLMNQEAKALGMNGTHYTDPTGLPHPDHYTTPHDVATLARAIITNFPQYYHWYKQKWFTYDGIKQSNRNKLLWRDPSVDGMKTGHTEAAGYCLVASAERDGMRLISVVMGAPTDNDRDEFNEQLLNYGFRFYQSYNLYKANTTITKARVWYGSKGEVPLGVSNDLAITLPTGQYKDVKANINLNKRIKAPVAKGTAYGKITLSLNGKVLTERPLVALANDPEAGMFSRLTDYIELTVKNLFSSDKS